MKKILLCILMILAMFLVLTSSSFARDGTRPIGEGISVEWPPLGNTADDKVVDYNKYTIHDPGWLVSNLAGNKIRNFDNDKCAKCHMNSGANSIPEPKQRSPDMMKGNII